jgi:hypothetical protein
LRGALLLAAAGVAGAQGDLDVSMRVVDDVQGLGAAVIVIGPDAIETRVSEAPQPGAAEAAPRSGDAAAPAQ